MRGLALLGSDTGVGKTTVACALMRLATERGLALVPYKPAETGCLGAPPSDATLLQASLAPSLAGLTLADICPLSFDAPLAPSRAAALEGRSIDPEAMLHQAHHLASLGDALLLETAGGLLSPYTPDFTGADLVERLGLEVLLVVPNRLGAINQCALAVNELRRRSIPALSILLVQTRPPLDDPSSDYNLADIESLTGIRPLGLLPFVGHGARHSSAPGSDSADAPHPEQASTPRTPPPVTVSAALAAAANLAALFERLTPPRL